MVTRVEKIRNKNGELERIEHRGYLLPEFVSLTGMSDQQRQDYNTMKEIAPFTKLHPNERVENNDKIIKVLN